MHRLFMAALAVFALATPVLADGIQVTNTATVEVKTVNAEGKEEITYVAPDKVRPGDAVVYTISYTNTGGGAAEGVVLSSQIPADLTITEGTAETPAARTEYSVDGGASFGPRESLTVTGADGQQRPAMASDLTNVRWTMLSPLPAGADGSVSYRATVN